MLDAERHDKAVKQHKEKMRRLGRNKKGQRAKNANGEGEKEREVLYLLLKKETDGQTGKGITFNIYRREIAREGVMYAEGGMKGKKGRKGGMKRKKKRKRGSKLSKKEDQGESREERDDWREEARSH